MAGRRENTDHTTNSADHDERRRLERHQLLAGFALDVILFLCSDGRILDVNDAAVRTYGYSYEELLSMNVMDLRIPEERDLARGQLQQALDQGIIFETSHRRKDGSAFPVEVRSRSAVLEDERIIVSIVRDMTERKQVEEALEAERLRLRAVLDALPLAVWIADANGAMIETNDQAKAIWGQDAPIARRIEEYGQYKGWWADTGKPIAAEDWALARALTKGETSVGEIINIQRFDGKRGTILNSGGPIRDPEGRIIGAVVAAQDITELVRLQRELTVLLEASRQDRRRISAMESIAEAGISTLQLPELLNALAERIAVALRVHSSHILILDREKQELIAKAAHNPSGPLEWRIRSDTGFLGRICTEKRTLYVADAQMDPLVIHPLVKAPGVRSLLGTPLMVGGRIIGAAYVDTREPREFTRDEVRLLEAMAARATLAIENVQLYDEVVRRRKEIEEALEKERHFSLTLQRALLPGEPTIGPHYDLASAYIPAFTSQEIGGDFYDVFKTAAGCTAILIGDVSGKGLEAAALASATRNTIRAFAYETSSAADTLSRTNAVLCDLRGDEFAGFVTVFLAIISLEDGDVDHASAGHPPAAISHTDGTVEFLSYGNPPLGVFIPYQFGEDRYRLMPGDRLVLYTDGISEARNETDMFGMGGIARTLQAHRGESVDQLVGGLVSEAEKWAHGKLSDDVAILVVERQPADS